MILDHVILETMLVASTLVGTADPIACPRTHLMPGYPETAVVIVLDGEVLAPDGGTPAQRLLLTEMEEPGIMEQRCWNPDTDKITTDGGIQLILLATPERVAASEAAAIGVARRVSAHIEETGALPTSLAPLGSATQGFHLEVADEGWKVVAANSEAVHCSVFQDEGGGSPIVQCGLNYESIGANLREVYERGRQP